MQTMVASRPTLDLVFLSLIKTCSVDNFISGLIHAFVAFKSLATFKKFSINLWFIEFQRISVKFILDYILRRANVSTILVSVDIISACL